MPARAAFLLVAAFGPATSLWALSVLTYNVAGNGATDWSTNAPQVQAIGRQMLFLQPDVVTFQEIPFDLGSEMTNFVKAYLPGYFLAQNSGTEALFAARSRAVIPSPVRKNGSTVSASPISVTQELSPETFSRPKSTFRVGSKLCTCSRRT